MEILLVARDLLYGNIGYCLSVARNFWCISACGLFGVWNMWV